MRAQGARATIEALPDDSSLLRWPGVAAGFALPTPRASLLATLPIGSLTVIAVGLARAEGAARLDLAALIAADGAALRLVGLEVMGWHGADGARLSTRLAGVGDRSRVRLLRQSALPLGPTRWEREHWTDYLALGAGPRLVDAPVRAPLPETRQHALAQHRMRAAALVDAADNQLTTALLDQAGLQVATFSLSVSAQPSMRQAPSGPRTIV